MHAKSRRTAPRTWFSFELELNASPIFCDVDFSLCGCMLDAAESVLPFSMSPKCSVVDFSESGYDQAHRQRGAPATRTNDGEVVHTFAAAVNLSVKLWRPVSDMVLCGWRDRKKLVMRWWS